MLGGALIRYAILVVARREALHPIGDDVYYSRAVAHSARHRVRKTRYGVGLMINAYAVDDNHNIVDICGIINQRHKLLDKHHLVAIAHPHNTILHKRKHTLDDALRLFEEHRRSDNDTHTFILAQHVVDNIVDLVATYLEARDWRICATYTREEQL